MLAVYDKSEGRWSIADEPVCTARWATPSRSHDAGDPCGQPATGRVGDVDLCPHHYRRALDWFFECHVPEAPERHEAARKEQAKRARLAAEARSIVYFLRRESDGLVKIGFTTGYRSRLASLRGEHGALRLLLAIAGHREREREMHLKFAAQRVAGEWFRADEALLFAVLQARNSLGRLQETRLPEQVPHERDPRAAEGRQSRHAGKLAFPHLSRVGEVLARPHGQLGAPLKLDDRPAVTVGPPCDHGHLPPGAVTEEDLTRLAERLPGAVVDVVSGKGHLKGGALPGIAGRHEDRSTRTAAALAVGNLCLKPVLEPPDNPGLIPFPRDEQLGVVPVGPQAGFLHRRYQAPEGVRVDLVDVAGKLVR